MEQTYHEAQASRLGWPLGVQGYGPNEAFYYHEPGLGWANALLNPARHGLDPVASERELGGLLSLPVVWNENMAPRFPTGTWLAGVRVRVGKPVALGAVLCFWLAGDAPDCPTWARVVAVQRGELRLACDNGAHPYCLPWTLADAQRVGRVYLATHYCRLPYPGHA